MSLWGWLMGGGKMAEKVADGVMAGADKLVYTDEEKAEARAQAREWFLRYLQATQPQNVARRLIALILVALFAGLILLGVLAWPWAPEWSAYIFQTVRDLLVMPVGVIVGFYFAKQIVTEWKGK